ncbi:cobalamin-binding protein [Kribbella sp. NPDC056345]|uniref:cobalamin-binding protein n=1 Tax=Kribbella sp. NPDC056345 TaxID=3345789 RepID=UPI0035D71A52
MRIVSLLPSATEICFALGAGDSVVGVTFECDYPAAARTRRIVSTTTLPEGLTPGEIDAVVRARVAAGEDLYKLDAGALQDLNPDVIITQDLCAACALDTTDVSSALDYLGCTAKVVTTNPHTLPEVLTSIEQIAKAINRNPTPLLTNLTHRLTATTGTAGTPTTPATAGRSRPQPPERACDPNRRPERRGPGAHALGRMTGKRVALLEWTDPPYAPGHWLPEQVELAGGVNILGTAGARSHPVEWSALAGAEVVIVAPCGFGVDAAYELAEGLVHDDLLPIDSEVWAVDSNSYFARPGPRLIEGIELLTQILTAQTPDPTQARRIR